MFTIRYWEIDTIGSKKKAKNTIKIGFLPFQLKFLNESFYDGEAFDS